MEECSLTLGRPFSLRLTLGALQVGGYDPCARFEGNYFWWATRTCDGPATLCLSTTGRDSVKGRAWGAGAANVLSRLPEIVGEHQNDGAFSTEHDLVAQLHHQMPGLRIPKAGNVWEASFAVILAQRVTGMEALRSYRNITRLLSEPAPGPGKLMLPVSAESIANRPYWWFHRFGIERKRAEVLRNCARVAKRLDALADKPLSDARKTMHAIPGLGLWTSASVALIALGDQDAVPVGDYHFADHVSWALAKEPRGTDQRMLELLEPFRGHRGRVLQLLLKGAPGAPKFGPRYSPMPIAAL